MNIFIWKFKYDWKINKVKHESIWKNIGLILFFFYVFILTCDQGFQWNPEPAIPCSSTQEHTVASLILGIKQGTWKSQGKCGKPLIAGI